MTSAPLDTRRVPRPRGDLTAAQVRQIKRLQAKAETAQDELEAYVVEVFNAGGSQRAIQETTGIAHTTVMRWVAARKPER